MTAPRHDYYLILKARNYYKNSCPDCGRPKSIQSKRCSVCAGVAPKINLCECGGRKHPQAKRCLKCARALAVPPLHKPNAPLNTFCPNGDFGASQCETYKPHVHCRECSEPILDISRTLCDTCKKDAARIAARRLKRVA